MKKLNSLSIFFPFYNDAGTVEKAISEAYLYGQKNAKHLEVIAIHGGDSKDDTKEKILQQKKKHSNLVVIDKSNNKEGYAVIKYGLKRAKHEWIFYTDGDLQYDLADLEKLVQAQFKTGADIVNGYKTKRSDTRIRVILGKGYRFFARLIFRLPIRDLDCDFRLIRKKNLDKITLSSKGASVTLELIKKLQSEGAMFAQIPVKHRVRIYGSSSYSSFQLLWEKITGDFKIWLGFRK